MTLTIKDPPEVLSQAKAGSPSQRPENTPGQSPRSVSAPRSNPVCLEVPVTIRSLPGEHDNGAGASGPIREEGRSVIVFDNGAVLRISNALPVGQTVILSNQHGRDVVCRVAGGRNLPNIKGYIEVEFIEPVDDFWQIHQNSAPAGAPSAAVPTAPVPTIAMIEPATVPPSPAQPLTTRAATPAVEPSLGSAPSFEDIAGLVRMTPPAMIREKKIEPVRASSAQKTARETADRPAEAVTSLTSTSVVPSVHGSPSVKPVDSPMQEAISIPLRSSAFSNDLAGRDTLATAQSSSVSSSISTSGESRGRTSLILGGVALVLLGFGAGFFLMHRGSASTGTSAAVASLASAQPPTVANNTTTPISSPDMAQAPQQTVLATATAGSVSSTERPSAQSDAPNAQRSANIVESKQPEHTQARSSSIPNLKMSSPTAPGQSLANLTAGSSLGEPDVTMPAATGGVPGVSLLSSAARTENQPAPPPGAATPVVAASKTLSGPKLVTTTRAVYPEMAKQTKVQGRVVVACNVDPNGNVVTAKAVSGPILLQQAAVDAVKKWKYSPALLDGKPTSSQINVDLDFRLN